VRSWGSRAAAHRPHHAASTPADEIARLHELHKAGALTDEEFAKLKADALA
jgi:hypothetical protein